jgi:SulP family sulfate permease
VLFGGVGLGRLIKYMPYPVVSGYLSGVGLYIIFGQVPKFLGSPAGTKLGHALLHPSLWAWQAITVGAVTIFAMLFAPRLTQRVPAAILALLAGVLSYFGLSLLDAGLLDPRNPLVIGPLGSSGGGGFVDTVVGRWSGVGQLGAA